MGNKINDIKPAREIGKGQTGASYIYIACPDCGKERWVRFLKGKPETTYCYDCAIKRVGFRQRGKHNPLWRGGKIKVNGYITVILTPADEFFYPMMSSRRRILEHRLIMAKHLKRCLLPWEIVHHKNGIRDDNRIENLQLVSSRSYHIVDTHIKAENKRLHKRIAQLEKRLSSIKPD